MSYETDFDTAFAILLGKARGNITQTGTPPTTGSGGGGGSAVGRTFNIAFEWSGAGQTLTLTATDPIIVELPAAARLVWAHLYAGDGVGNGIDVDADIELRVTSLSTFGSTTPMYGTGSKPSLSAQMARNLDLSGWLLNYDAGDTIVAYMTSFTGSANWVTLTLQMQEAVLITGVTEVIDNATDVLVLADGSTLTLRT